MTNDWMLGSLYLLMAVMLIAGTIDCPARALRSPGDNGAGLDRDLRRRVRAVHLPRRPWLCCPAAEGRGDRRAGNGTGRGPAGQQQPGCRSGPVSVAPGQGGRRRSRCSDQGSATVWSVGAIAVLCVVFGVVLALGHVVVVRHRAAGSADLAALAAADHWMRGGTAACARADRVARAQDTRLVRCVITGEVSDVSVESGRGPFTVEVRARAGPAGPVEPSPRFRIRV